MEFWSKGLGKKTIAMGLSSGESMMSEDSLCLKGIMDEPVSWEYVMLLDEDDLNDFFAILQEPSLARYIHRSPNRWRLYAGLAKGGVQIASRVIASLLKSAFGNAPQAEKVVIELPPPAAVKKKKTKIVLYRRKLSTTTLKAPSMTPGVSIDVSTGAFKAGQA
jgi:hypothetical protein